MAHSKPKKDAQITLRLTSDTKRGLYEAADRLDRSVNWLAEGIFEEWLGKQRRRRSRKA